MRLFSATAHTRRWHSGEGRWALVITGLDPVICNHLHTPHRHSGESPESSFTCGLPQLDPGFRRGDEWKEMAGSSPAMTKLPLIVIPAKALQSSSPGLTR